MKCLILAHPGDELALRVFTVLSARHAPGDVRLVGFNELIVAPHWSYQMVEGRTAGRIQLHDGTLITDDALECVFNRLRFCEHPRFAHALADDRDYARMETFALLVSWLNSLPCPVINRTSPRGLGGGVHETISWQLMAARAGLAVGRSRRTSGVRRRPAGRVDSDLASVMGTGWFGEALGEERRSILVAGERAIALEPGWTPLPAWMDGCVRLARLSGCALLQVSFAMKREMPGEWVFVSANPCPETSDPAGIVAIAELLGSPGGERK